MASVFILPVYADGDTYTEDGQENLVRAIAIIEKYKQYRAGECTDIQFQIFAAQQTGKSYYDTVVDRTLVVQILNDCGIDIDGWVAKYLNDDYIDDVLQDKLKGHGAYAKEVYDDGSCCIYYGTYGIIFRSNGSKQIQEVDVIVRYDSNGTVRKEYVSGGFGVKDNAEIGGDWRYDTVDGDIVPMPDIDVPDNVDDMTDNDFNNFLDDLIKELNKLKVDLNSMLSILQAILQQVASINSKMVTSSQFSSAMQSILKALEDLKPKELTEEEQEQQLQQQIQDQEKIDTELFVPKDSINEKLLSLQNLWLSKFSFISQFKACFELIKYNDCDNVSIDMSLYGQTASIDLSMFNNIRDVVRVMLAAFIYFSYAVRQFKRMPVIIGGGGDEM